MAEVGQRLGSGVYRLTALRNGPARPVCTGESPGSLLARSTFSESRIREGSTQDRPEVQPVSTRRATRRKSKKVFIVGARESPQENGTLRCAACLELDSDRFIGFVQTRDSLQAYKTALYLSARLQPVLQEKLLPGRMTPWSRGSVSILHDTFRSPQQLRTFCTVIFFLAEQRSERPGSGLRLRRLKPHPDTPQTTVTSRSYSWQSNSGSKDVPPLYRSRTAYYDILKVSPGATQAQIKTAYYKQSFIYHPDKNPGNEEATLRFSEISEAYQVLGNISLRRKYDRGILSQPDLQGAGRPSSKETSSKSTGSSQQQQYYTGRRFSQGGGKTKFDFDAFYKAHYGEQLQRERELRARKQRMQEEYKDYLKKYRHAKMLEVTVVVLLATAGMLLYDISR